MTELMINLGNSQFTLIISLEDLCKAVELSFENLLQLRLSPFLLFYFLFISSSYAPRSVHFFSEHFCFLLLEDLMFFLEVCKICRKILTMALIGKYSLFYSQLLSLE